MKKKDRSGERYGRLTVIRPAATAHYPSGQQQTMWLCVCDCGGTAIASASNLVGGHTKSCGCLKAAAARRNGALSYKPGEENPNMRRAKREYGEDYVSSTDPWYRRAYLIKARCDKAGINIGFGSMMEFAGYLKLIAGDVCPVFGVPYSTTDKNWSASVDRIDPTKGYEPGNLRVISFLANAMKRDANDAQLRQFATWVLENTDG